jgi:hypothetical protein
LRESVGVNRKDVKDLYAYCCNKIREVWQPEATHQEIPKSNTLLVKVAADYEDALGLIGKLVDGTKIAMNDL